MRNWDWQIETIYIKKDGHLIIYTTISWMLNSWFISCLLGVAICRVNPIQRRVKFKPFLFSGILEESKGSKGQPMGCPFLLKMPWIS
jgi:hypothetical protein